MSLRREDGSMNEEERMVFNRYWKPKGFLRYFTVLVLT